MNADWDAFTEAFYEDRPRFDTDRDPGDEDDSEGLGAAVGYWAVSSSAPSFVSELERAAPEDLDGLGAPGGTRALEGVVLIEPGAPSNTEEAA